MTTNESALAKRIAQPGQKRILSLDGGGIRGIITLEILAKIEDQLRTEYNRGEDFVLADYFDYIAGTSTGAIIGTLLSMGKSVSEIRSFYLDFGKSMFEHASLLDRFKWKYTDQAFSEKLHEIFGKDTTLGSEVLQTVLMVVMRNANTDHPWAISNNPNSKFNLDQRHSHLHLPLWKLIRASTAAPSFFPPEEIKIGDHDFLFIDGGISSYNNPAFRAFINATAQPFGLGWATGVDNLLLVSIGTGSIPHENMELKRSDMNLMHDVVTLIPSILLSTVQEQDTLCRLFGNCLYGGAIDKEVGTLINTPSIGAEKLFTYLRYDGEISRAGLDELELNEINPADVAKLDSIEFIPELIQIGETLAMQQVKAEHFSGFCSDLQSEFGPPKTT